MTGYCPGGLQCRKGNLKCHERGNLIGGVFRRLEPGRENPGLCTSKALTDHG